MPIILKIRILITISDNLIIFFRLDEGWIADILLRLKITDNKHIIGSTGVKL